MKLKINNPLSLPKPVDSITDKAGWKFIRNAALIIAFIGACCILLPNRHWVDGHYQYVLRGIWVLSSYQICPWFAILGVMASHWFKPSMKVRKIVGIIGLISLLILLFIYVGETLTGSLMVNVWYRRLINLILLFVIAFVLTEEPVKLHRGKDALSCLLVFVLSTIMYITGSYLCYGVTQLSIFEGNLYHYIGLSVITATCLVISCLSLVGIAMSKAAFRIMSPGIVKLPVLLVCFVVWALFTFYWIFYWPNTASFGCYSKYGIVSPFVIACIVYLPRVTRKLATKM